MRVSGIDKGEQQFNVCFSNTCNMQSPANKALSNDKGGV